MLVNEKYLIHSESDLVNKIQIYEVNDKNENFPFTVLNS